MSTVYPLRFSDQLRQHLKGLRKQRGLTQAKLGQLIGVSQARIAEIEANPGLVNLDQLLQVFSALGVTLTVEDAATATTPIDRPGSPVRSGNAKPDPTYTEFVPSPVSSPGDWKAVLRSYATPYEVNVPTPNWHVQPIRNTIQSAENDGSPAPDATPNDDARSMPQQATQTSPDKDHKPASKPKSSIRPKKGSW